MADDLKNAVKKAAVAGDAAALTQLVAAHGGPAIRADDDPAELTALHWAAASGNVEAVRFLLGPSVGADPRAARMNNFTPLHSAAMQGHAAVCELLLQAGAEVNVQTNPQGYAPLHKLRDLRRAHRGHPGASGARGEPRAAQLPQRAARGHGEAHGAGGSRANS